MINLHQKIENARNRRIFLNARDTQINDDVSKQIKYGK